ncbi:tRNA lysidine(34) synthetase TilS [Promicromonospora citrea]|uniref:tRNA(Ile)-lysidine synthase n=3 Tax=Promicromonospora citrea TaxID=43677 RepID=A0A8H9GFM4_9MICO|nr:tRNA lysidine(34) synthetase TilS [Promicromonospora citrea]GGM19441.1 tRNA(Ile)-lysidine synthase [Promicromonospora citrea]
MARVDPAVAAARTAVRAVLADLDPGDLVLVACSGGADSLALAAATAAEARRVGRSVRSRGYAVRAGAVVVDHGLQPDSADVARRAAEQCRDLGLDPVEVRPAEWQGTGAGPEGGARAARYAAIERVAHASGARVVLLGHTLDDQAEQVLLGLARGAGARSLAGMPRARGIYRRPFLGLRRAQTEAVCAALGLGFWTDPTNLLPRSGVEISAGDRADVASAASAVPDGTDGTADGAEHRTEGAAAGFVPLRSRVRGRVLPVLEDTLGPGVAEALARSAAQLRDDADLLDALAADLLERATSAPAAAPGTEPGPAAGDVRWLDPGVLAPAHAALRRRALRAAALAVGCAPSDTTARHVDALDALVVAWTGQGPVHLPGGARAGRACGRVFLRAAPSATADGQDGDQPPGTTQE